MLPPRATGADSSHRVKRRNPIVRTLMKGMTAMNDSHTSNPRRNFLKLSAGLATGLGSGVLRGSDNGLSGDEGTGTRVRHYNATYSGSHLNHVAFPLGGIGAGMLCLEGTGALSHFSIRNKPDVYNEPCVFAALAVRRDRPLARVLEGYV